MKSVNKYIAIAAIGMLTACSADDIDVQNEDAIHEMVVLSAGIAQESLTSRAQNWDTPEWGKTFSTSPKWGTNLLIALAFSDQNDLTTLTNINNKVKKYKVTENQQAAAIAPFNDNNRHYWSSKTKTHYACGWCFPYDESGQAEYHGTLTETYVHTVLTNQDSPDKMNCKDFLFAPKQSLTYPTGSTSAQLTFYHQKNRIEILFATDKGNTDYTFSNFTKCVLKNVYNKGTWSLPASGENYGTFTTTGSTTDITLYRTTTDYFNGIMIPQSLKGKTIEFTTNIDNNETVSYTFDDELFLEPGKRYRLTFVLNQNKKLTLKTQILDWIATTPINGTLNLE